MGFPCAICRVFFEQYHVGFDPVDPFLVGLWAKCLDYSGCFGSTHANESAY